MGRVMSRIGGGVCDFKYSEEAVSIAAMTQIQNVFVTPSGQKHASVSRGHGLMSRIRGWGVISSVQKKLLP